jgi:hypothetical protein
MRRIFVFLSGFLFNLHLLKNSIAVIYTALKTCLNQLIIWLIMFFVCAINRTEQNSIKIITFSILSQNKFSPKLLCKFKEGDLQIRYRTYCQSGIKNDMPYTLKVTLKAILRNFHYG